MGNAVRRGRRDEENAEGRADLSAVDGRQKRVCESLLSDQRPRIACVPFCPLASLGLVHTRPPIHQPPSKLHYTPIRLSIISSSSFLLLPRPIATSSLRPRRRLRVYDRQLAAGATPLSLRQPTAARPPCARAYSLDDGQLLPLHQSLRDRHLCAVCNVLFAADAFVHHGGIDLSLTTARTAARLSTISPGGALPTSRSFSTTAFLSLPTEIWHLCSECPFNHRCRLRASSHSVSAAPCFVLQRRRCGPVASGVSGRLGHARGCHGDARRSHTRGLPLLCSAKATHMLASSSS